MEYVEVSFQVTYANFDGTDATKVSMRRGVPGVGYVEVGEAQVAQDSLGNEVDDGLDTLFPNNITGTP